MGKIGHELEDRSVQGTPDSGVDGGGGPHGHLAGQPTGRDAGVRSQGRRTVFGCHYAVPAVRAAAEEAG